MNKKQVNIAGCLIEKDGKILLVQEAKPEVRGLWNLPAGHVDEGETIEQAAVREAKEESGYTVSIDEKLGRYLTLNSHQIHVFRAHIESGSLKFPADELLDAGWFTYDEIRTMGENQQLRGEYLIAVVEDRLNKAS